MHLGLRDLDIRTRFLLLPWSALWVYALRPRKQWLWCGAALGVFRGSAAGSDSGYCLAKTRAEGWVNAIVLADDHYGTDHCGGVRAPCSKVGYCRHWCYWRAVL